MPRFIDIDGGTPIAAAADARSALGSSEIGDAVFTAANEAAARSAIGAAPLNPDTAVPIQLNPATRPNGSISAGDALDVGTVFSNTGAKPLKYVSGRLAHDAGSTIGVSSAGYLQVDVGDGTVREMRAECSWTANEIGAVAFVIPSSLDVWSPPGSLPAAGVHLTAYGNGVWECGVWNPAAGTPGHVDHSVQPGTATTFTLTVQTTTPASTQTTASITAGASAADVKAAIEALSNIAVGEVTVTKSTSGNYGITWATSLGSVTLTATGTGMGIAAPLPLVPSNTIAAVVSYSGPAVTQYATWSTVGRYATVWDDKLRWFELYIYPDTDELFVIFPDGSNSGMIKHPGIGLWCSDKAVYELFEGNGSKIDTPAKFGRIAASNVLVNSEPGLLNTIAAYKTVTLYDSGNGTAGNVSASGSLPPGTAFVEVVLIGGGGGGGSGGCQPSGTSANGGSAGGSGGVIREIIPASALSTSWGVTVGLGGAGGNSISSTGTGNNGGDGGLTKFSSGITTLQAYPGGGGRGGTTGATVAATGNPGGPFGTAGSTTTANGGVGTAGAQMYTALGNPGSGSGGGITTAPAANNGGAGGANLVRGYFGGDAGVVGGAPPGRGKDATATPITSTPAGVPGPGVGGGAASITGAAQAGADGAGWGIGGGGGGASLNGNASGAGGNGRGGYAIVRAHFL